MKILQINSGNFGSTVILCSIWPKLHVKRVMKHLQHALTRGWHALSNSRIICISGIEKLDGLQPYIIHLLTNPLHRWNSLMRTGQSYAAIMSKKDSTVR